MTLTAGTEKIQYNFKTRLSRLPQGAEDSWHTRSIKVRFRMKINDTLQQAHGSLEKVEQQHLDRVDFEWEGIRFTAQSRDDSADGPRITIQAQLGRLYVTVENPEMRAMAIERLYATNRGIDGRYKISSRGDVSFYSETSTDEQLYGADLMGALTLILLESEPHLRALKNHLKPPNS